MRARCLPVIAVLQVVEWGYGFPHRWSKLSYGEDLIEVDSGESVTEDCNGASKFLDPSGEHFVTRNC